jgi:hypothetical protein
MPLVDRLLRRHRAAPGDVLLGLVDDAGYVRDRSVVALGVAVGRSDAEMAVVVRALSGSLDLRRREVMRLCAVLCRSGPVVWLPDDVRWRAAVDREAEFRGVRRGRTFLVTEAGWRDDVGGTGLRPNLPAPEPSPWD